MGYEDQGSISKLIFTYLSERDLTSNEWEHAERLSLLRNGTCTMLSPMWLFWVWWLMFVIWVGSEIWDCAHLWVCQKRIGYTEHTASPCAISLVPQVDWECYFYNGHVPILHMKSLSSCARPHTLPPFHHSIIYTQFCECLLTWETSSNVHPPEQLAACRSVQSSRWQWEGNTHSCTSTSVGFGRGVLDFRCCHWNHAGDSAIAWASEEGGRLEVTIDGPGKKKRLEHFQRLYDLQCKCYLHLVYRKFQHVAVHTSQYK